ncbi:hypothetical protein BC941DRAFT_248617 [Chlamydoabsidia padenii]|nr:hypothetical protein BC941DRAFT_248617 [Chlamydoabsidia padenii]
MIYDEEHGIIKVKSFNLEIDLVYTITLSENENSMVSCTCFSFARGATRCKHMFLVNRVHPILFPDIVHLQHVKVSIQQPTNNQQDANPDNLARAVTILNANNDRLQALLGSIRYDDQAASVVMHAAQQINDIWSTLKDAEHPMRQYRRRF